jgi:hypothetical protein
VERKIPVQFPRGVWSAQICHPYESAFGLFHKYAWLNCIDLDRTAQRIFNSPQVRAPRDFSAGHWMADARLHAPTQMRVLEGVIRSYSTKWGPRLVSPRHFRYCPACLDGGFHSIFYQIEALAVCPYHQLSLTTECSHCHAPTAPIALPSDEWVEPFRCTRCSKSLSPILDPALWSGSVKVRESIKNALDPIAQWLAELDRAYPEGIAGQLPLTQLRALPSLCIESEEVVVGSIAHRLVPLRMDPKFIGGMKRPLEYTVLTLDYQSRSSGEDVNELALSCAVAYNSARKMIMRHHLFNHDDCMRTQRPAVSIKYMQDHAIVVPEEGVCPLVAAFRHWELRNEWRIDGPVTSRGVENPYDYLRRVGTEVYAAEIAADFETCSAIALLWMEFIWLQGANTSQLKEALWNFSRLERPPALVFYPSLNMAAANEHRRVLTVSSSTRAIDALRAHLGQGSKPASGCRRSKADWFVS